MLRLQTLHGWMVLCLRAPAGGAVRAPLCAGLLKALSKVLPWPPSLVHVVGIINSRGILNVAPSSTVRLVGYFLDAPVSYFKRK